MLGREYYYSGSAVHGMNPSYLIEKIIRERILDTRYYKEHCFGLTAETILDKVVNLKYIGGQYSNQKPTEFLCLIFKLLQIHPEKEIIEEYLKDQDFKYLRSFAAFYIRLTFPPVECFKILEPLLVDYRKLKVRANDGFQLTFMDQFIDDLLTQERVCDIALPRLPSRYQLEETEEIEPRESPLKSELNSQDGMESSDED
ncbi:Pre-mRNA-splicing factor 38A [Neolecta irregularis DAH-3]|uniref:Pre-mRNA-splicing factor 38 n=1 Tax=Neolecta irregularis (strain DAH-3) TaxID=1198029 RepID=A0A1U7LHH2_NEOID|nr:Pre-mRNA-splicing factor 38A [Neolecta irregularis DAH-3]|eukprot:OLL22043.1 Pre-mRNA-splicing factor 38A [Neolecta irregularis DAH-3]